MNTNSGSTKKRKAAAVTGATVRDGVDGQDSADNFQGDKQRGLPSTDQNGIGQQANDDGIEEISLVQDMLVVPYEYIFREVPSSSSSNAVTSPKGSQHHRQRHKPLLSRSEAQCLVQVNLLAHEIDSLTAISNQALQQQVLHRDFSLSLHRSGRHPFLRPLLPILHTLEQDVTMSTLNKVVAALDLRIVPELQRHAQQLQQSSEQNWTLYETLLDSVVATGPSSEMGRVLAEEKRKLSDVQEELRHRINALLRNSTSTDNNSSSTDDPMGDGNNEPLSSSLNPTSNNPTLSGESMKVYCDRIFRQGEDEQTAGSSSSAAAAARPESMDKGDEVVPSNEAQEMEVNVAKPAAAAAVAAVAEAVALSCSAVSSPATSSARPVRRVAGGSQGHGADAAASTTATKATTSSRATAAKQDSLVATATATASSSSRLFEPRRLMESSASKTNEEKENTPSQHRHAASQSQSQSQQSQSQSSSQARSPMVHESSILETLGTIVSPKRKIGTEKSQLEMVATAAAAAVATDNKDDNDNDDEYVEETEGFQSQGAALVLTHMAAAGSKKDRAASNTTGSASRLKAASAGSSSGTTTRRRDHSPSS